MDDHDTGFLLPVGTVTLLLADVEGSTRKWQAGEEAMAAAMDELSALVADLIGRHNGVRPLEQGEGDSFVAAFARASEAVTCAVDIQRALADAPLRLRIGIHSGEAQRRADKTFVGPAVNRTARLRDAGHGGQVLLSQATMELAADRLPEGSSAVDLGRHRLKDLTRPEHVFQLTHPELRLDFPALRSLESYRHNLPIQRTPLFGRQREIADVGALLTESRLVTIHGAGGCGKTRLALEVAAGALDLHPDGVFFVDLSPVRDPDQVPATIADVLGLGQEAEGALFSYLREKSLVVVLDNCEHLVDVAAQVVEDVLAASKTVRVLTTSREPLGVTGEVAFRVPPLPVPPPGVDGIRRLSPYAAAELFVDRGRRARSDFDPTDADAAAIAEICRRLDGVPLAIELAAARVRALTPEDIATGLDERFRLLTGGGRTALPRQQTLQASVDWSHDLLSNDERAVFRRLAVFTGSFGLEAARDVCASGGVESHHVIDLLGLLVDKSLVVSHAEGADSRFRLLESMREYALARLADAAETDDTRRRHSDHFLGVAERLGPFELGPTERVTSNWARLDADFDNVRAAYDRCRASDDIEATARFLVALWPYLRARRSQQEPERWFADISVRLDDVSAETGANLAMCSTKIRPRLASTLERVLQEHRAAGRPGLAARAAIGLLVSTMLTQPERRLRLIGEALADARAGGDVVAEASVLTWAVGPVSWLEPYDIEPHVAALLGIARDHPGMSVFLTRALAACFRAKGDYRRAREIFENEDPRGAGLISEPTGLDLGACLAANAEFDAAHQVLREALSWAEEVHDIEGITRGRHELGVLEAARGNLEACIELERSALDAFRAGSGMFGYMFVTRAQSVLAIAEAALGNWTAAHAALDAVASMAAPGGAQSWIDVARTAVARAQADHENAERWAFEALEGGFKWGVTSSVTSSLELLAGLSVASGSYEEGVRLLGSATTLREERGDLARLAPLQEWYAHDVAIARAELGNAEFDRTWSAGATTPWREVVAWALRGRGGRKRPPSGWASLTPTERQVVDLVVEGLSNNDVGVRLFISTRTVASHLRNIYTKLDVATRTELAAAHRRRPSI